MKTINVGKDFSENPAGRTIELDGPDSGEAFRVLLIGVINTLSEKEKIEIILDDGVISYGSSFISEAFGAIVREGHMSADSLLETLTFKYEHNQSYMEFVANKIKDSIRFNERSPR